MHLCTLVFFEKNRCQLLEEILLQYTSVYNILWWKQMHLISYPSSVFHHIVIKLHSFYSKIIIYKGKIFSTWESNPSFKVLDFKTLAYMNKLINVLNGFSRDSVTLLCKYFLGARGCKYWIEVIKVKQGLIVKFVGTEN